MLPCKKRQTIVNRSDGTTRHKCMNKQCPAFNQGVDARACELCTDRVFDTKRPCLKNIRPDEMVARANIPNVPVMTDEEVLELVNNSPFEKEFKQHIADMPEDMSVPEYPAMTLQLWLYKDALIRWNKAGRPVRSSEEVERISTQICQKCDWYDKEAKRCKGCGCKVSNSAIAIFNKIKMATEHCPKELW